jgi:heat shock protein 4
MKGGIDFGSRNSSIAIAKGKIEVIQNEVSSRQTAGCVGFNNKKRELGEAGLDQLVRNARNSVYGVKLLLGRKYDDEEFKKNLARLGACKWISSPNGNIGVEVDYLGKPLQLTGEQLNGCLFTKLKKTVEASMGAQLQYCVISVPGFWSHTQRRAAINSTRIAGLNVIKIVNELSAVAFNYGFYHPQQFPKPEYIMFIDMGYSSFSCGVYEMSNPSCKSMSAAYDQNLGGAEIDDILANYFAENFNKKYKTRLQDNVKAWMKLLLQVEKVKKTLNMNEQASISMDCLHEDYDLQDKLSRTKYLEMLNEANIPQRVVNCVKQALEKSGITAEQLHSVEAVGSSTRVQAVRDAIQDLLGKSIGSKMNAEEAVAIGCALYCARHSPASSTRAYDLIENTNVPVKVSWKTLNDPNDTKVTDMEIFPVNYLIPKTKTRNVTLNRVDAKPFEISLQYAPVRPEDVTFGNNVIATCQVPKILKDNEMTRDAKVVVKLKAEPIGTFHFAEVEMQEEKEEIIEVPIEETKPEEGAEKKEDDTKEGSEIKTDAPKTRQEKKKVIHSTKISHQIFSVNELSEDQVNAYKKIEGDMTAQDDLIISTANAKNELETYVYAANEKVSGIWKDFGSKQEKDAVEELCGQITIWLYDDGADVARVEYETRLKAVKDLAEKLNLRYREWEEVPPALEALQQTINSLRNEAQSREEKYAHIKEEELQKVNLQCDDAHKYLEEKMEAYQARGKANDPVFLSSDLKMRTENLNINCKKILNTPKPIPKKEEPKKEEPKKEEPKPEEPKTEEKPAAKEPTVEMDTDVD